MKQIDKGDFILKLLKEFSESSSSTIAEIAVKVNPEYFSTTEQARTLVRYYRGTLGRASRKYADLSHVERLPDVLLLDIETAPMIAATWSLFKPLLGYHNIIEDWFIISWAAKWLYGSEIIGDVVTPAEAVELDDKRICESVFKLMDKADVIIAHNGKRFDIRKINSRFILHGINPPSPYQVIDTLEHSRKNFAHSSHRLDYLGRMLLNKEKIDTEYKLWLRCKVGELEALKEMDEYCRNDVLLLEEVYVEMRGWIKSHPNLALYAETDSPVCPNCLSKNIDFWGEYVTPANVFNSLRCKDCGGIMRMRKSKLTPTDKDKLRLSISR